MTQARKHFTEALESEHLSLAEAFYNCRSAELRWNVLVSGGPMAKHGYRWPDGSGWILVPEDGGKRWVEVEADGSTELGQVVW